MRISWFACSEQSIIVSWCIWKILKNMPGNVWVRSCLFSYCTTISMASSLKKDQSKMRFFNWYWFVINGKKRYQRWKYHAIYWYVKDNNMYMKTYDKQKELSYFKYWNVNNLYGWSMSKKLPLGRFKCAKDTS